MIFLVNPMPIFPRLGTSNQDSTMTFIASVNARDGVAIIADSLVTSQTPSLDFASFVDYIRSKNAGGTQDELHFTEAEILDLFQYRTSHTQNYEKKLFQYDQYTAITTAGNAEINGKRIEEIVLNAKNIHQSNSIAYQNQTTQEKVADFAFFMTRQVMSHLQDKQQIGSTTFIYTHYSPRTKQSEIFKILVHDATTEDASDPDFQLVSYSKSSDNLPVICDGQNRISERILYGGAYDIGVWKDVIASMIETVLTDFNIDSSKIPSGYVDQMTSFKSLFSKANITDVNINKLQQLSLQQAVDLAGLLMRVEIDFQKYTTLIPTVGGVIRLAVIDEHGFRYLAGDQILPPPHITYS
jgi:hypothetical protein